MEETQVLLKERELVRLRVIRRALLGLPAHTAADMLKLSTRQVFRLKARVRARGDSYIVHDNRGRQPANALPVSLRQRVLQLHRAKFSKYNDYHFVEALEEEYHIKLNPETARRWLRAAGIPPRRRHRSRSNRRRQRERRPRFGELVFIDGSPHPWLGPSRPALTLILATDDATGRPLYGQFDPQETLAGCFGVFYHVARRHGLPEALYLDKAGQFTTTRHGGTHRFQRDDEPAQFEVAMQTLAVQIIFADSPQARGRGERINQSFQDRLVAKLDHHHITDPAHPRRLFSVSASGDRLCAADTLLVTGGCHRTSFDSIADPVAPVLVGQTRVEGGADRLAVVGDTLYTSALQRIRPLTGVAEQPAIPKADPQTVTGVIRGTLRLPGSPLRRHPSLFDATGRKTMDLALGKNDVRHLAPGVHFVRQSSDVMPDASSVQRVVIQRQAGSLTGTERLQPV